ncbi:TIGR04086 family membrane protein [Bacillus tianshenii]|nr:TIGR04086 family membrane protein [Bacillus tianshenii]
MGKHTWMAVLYGIIAIVVIVLVSSMILSLLLKMTNLTEQSLAWVILVLSFLALFIGGFISGGKNKEKGWLTGAGTGALFTGLVFLIQYLGYQSAFSMEQMLYHLGYIMTAVLGGIIGVNMKGGEKRA